MVKPATKHRRPQVDAATIEIFVNDRFQRLDGGLPDGQGANIGAGLDKAMERWRKPVLRRNRLSRPSTNPRCFSSSRMSTNSQPAKQRSSRRPLSPSVTERDGDTITPAFAMVRARATNQPAGSVAAPLKCNSNLLGAHRDTAKARLAIV